MGNHALQPANDDSASSRPTPVPYPSVSPLPLPASHSPSSSSVYLEMSNCLTDFALSKFRSLLASASPLDSDADWTSSACPQCDFTPAAAVPANEARHDGEDAVPRMAHMMCRLNAKIVNTLMAATDSARMVVLSEAEGRWSAAITSRLLDGSEAQQSGQRTETIVHHLVAGDESWRQYLPQSVLEHVLTTRQLLSCSGPSPFHSDPLLSSFPYPPAFHCLPVMGDHANLHAVLFMLRPCSPSSPLPLAFSSPNFAGLHLLVAQLSAVYVNTRLMTRWDRANRSLERAEAARTQALERELEERRRVEVELTAAKAAADRNAAVKSDFLSNMSHEIRTPMNAVLGAARLLAATPLSGEQSHYLSLISTSGKLLLSLIGDILDINRIESGLMQIESRSFHLADCIETAVHLCHQTAASKGLDLAMVCDPTIPPTVEGDITRVSQVCINLLSNATKFTDHGYVMLNVRARDKGPLPATADTAQSPALPAPADGAVTSLPSTSPSRGPRSLSAPSPAGSAAAATSARSADAPVPLRRLVDIIITVTDTGQGISPEVQKRLFQVFSQGDASIVRRHGGSGLGLAISQRLAEKMGGKITVQSEQGMGSTFTFVFQAAATLPSVWHPLVRQQRELDQAAAAAAVTSPLSLSSSPTAHNRSHPSLSSSPPLPSSSPSSLSVQPLPFTYAYYELSAAHSQLLYNKRCLIICPLPASTRAYMSLCSGYGMQVSATTHIELAFPRSAEDDREEDIERLRAEQERAKSRMLPLQRILGNRTGYNATSSPLLHGHRGKDDGTGTDSGSDREGGAQRDTPKRLSSRLTLIVPPAALSSSATAESSVLRVPPTPDVILIVSQPQWEHERQRELSRLVRALNARAEQVLSTAAADSGKLRSSRPSSHRASPAAAAPAVADNSTDSDGMVDADDEHVKDGLKRRRADEDRDELHDETKRRKKLTARSKAGVSRTAGSERAGKAVIVEIRTPAKTVFLLKAMAKMLLRRESEAEARRGGSGRVQLLRRRGAPAVAEAERTDEDVGEEEAEEVQIDEMEDDEAVPDETALQRTTGQYRVPDSLPPLADGLISSPPVTPQPPSTPTPSSLPSSPTMSVHSAAMPVSPSSPAGGKVVKPSSSRARPSAATAAADSSGSSASQPQPLPYLMREYSPTSMTRARPVSSITPIAASYPLRLLLAEDNNINVRLMLMLLGKLGYHGVKVAWNGREVIDELQRTAGWKREGATALEGDEAECCYDVVLMDCSMDVMDGIECTHVIRRQEDRAVHYHYIIAQTANVHSEYQTMCEKAGMDGFLTKPVSCELLARQLVSAFLFHRDRRERSKLAPDSALLMTHGAAGAMAAAAEPQLTAG